MQSGSHHRKFCERMFQGCPLKADFYLIQRQSLQNYTHPELRFFRCSRNLIMV